MVEEDLGGDWLVRDKLWLLLRRSALLRWVYSVRILSGPMRRISFALMPGGRRARVRVQGGPGKGLLLEVNPRWEHRYWEGSYELKVQELVSSILGPGKTLFDVGANFGYYSILATRLGAQAVAFEPDPANLREFLQHVELNGLGDRIRLERMAVFSRTGEIVLDRAGGETPHGNAHVSASDSLTSGAIRVLCTSLDDFVLSSPVPTLVKMDVEGAESDVLKGAERLFESARPLLICEIHDIANETFITAWLERKKYVLEWLDSAEIFPHQVFAKPIEDNRPRVPL
jgi:FkbM family methyltransferase